MNILQLTSYNIPDSTTNLANGIARFVVQLGEYFIHQHHDACFLGYIEGKYDVTIAHQYSDIIKLDYNLDKKGFHNFLIDNKIDAIQINFSDPKSLVLAPPICLVAHQENVKVVFCLHFMPSYEGMPYCTLENVWYNLFHQRPFLNKLKKWLIRISQPLSGRYCMQHLQQSYDNLYQACDKVVLFSEPYIDKFNQITHSKDKTKFTIIPNPLSFNEFLPSNLVRGKKHEVIMVGRIQETQKRVSMSLKIWRQIERISALDDWTFTLIGNGEDEDFLHWLAKRYQLKRVHFEGRQDPRPYYERAAIFISTSGYEGWPMVLMEAMPMGCCCLSFDSYDAIHDIIDDGYNGLIISDNDINGYAKCLSELMLNEEKRITMSINAIESSHRFSMENIGERWRNLFVELAKN